MLGTEMIKTEIQKSCNSGSVSPIPFSALL